MIIEIHPRFDVPTYEGPIQDVSLSVNNRSPKKEVGFVYLKGELIGRYTYEEYLDLMKTSYPSAVTEREACPTCGR